MAIALGSTAQAQDDRAQQRTRLIKAFDSCVLTASLGVLGERNLAAEQSFVACQTEEQAIRIFLTLGYVPPGTTEAFIIRRKLQLKKIILQDPT